MTEPNVTDDTNWPSEISPLLSKGLKLCGYSFPSEVQKCAVPYGMKGESLLIQSESGSGKTVAFASILLHRLDLSASFHPTSFNLEPTSDCEESTPQRLQALVVCPTREIAIQAADEIVRLGWYMRQDGFNCLAIVGGSGLHGDFWSMRISQPMIIVASSGRLLSLLGDKAGEELGEFNRRRKFKLIPKWKIPPLKLLIFEEADKLLDFHFKPSTMRLLDHIRAQEAQILFVSATFPPPVVDCAESIFRMATSTSKISNKFQNQPLKSSMRSALLTSLDPNTEDFQVVTELHQPKTKRRKLEDSSVSTTDIYPAHQTTRVSSANDKNDLDDTNGRNVITGTTETCADGIEVPCVSEDVSIRPTRILRKLFLCSSYVSHADASKAGSTSRVLVPRGMSEIAPSQETAAIQDVDMAAPFLPRVQFVIESIDISKGVSSCFDFDLKLKNWSLKCSQGDDSITSSPLKDSCNVDTEENSLREEQENEIRYNVESLIDWLKGDKDWNHWEDLRVKFSFVCILIKYLWKIAKQIIIFCNDKWSGQKIGLTLRLMGISCACAYSKLDQVDRLDALQGMKANAYRVLICSDVFARGVDIRNVNVCISVDVPWDKDTLLHRMGRSSRFGDKGLCVFFARQKDEVPSLNLLSLQAAAKTTPLEHINMLISPSDDKGDSDDHSNNIASPGNH